MQRWSWRPPRSTAKLACIALIMAAVGGALACSSKKAPDELEQSLLAELQTGVYGMEGIRFTLDIPANYKYQRDTNKDGMPVIRYHYPGDTAGRAPSFLVELQAKNGQFPVSEYMVEQRYKPQEPGATIESMQPLAPMKNGWLLVTQESGPKGAMHVRSFWDANTRFALHCLGDYPRNGDPRAVELMKRVCGSMVIQYRDTR